MPVNSRARVLGGPFNDGWYWLEYQGTRGYARGSDLVQVDENYTAVPTRTPTPTNKPAPTGTPVPTNTPVPTSTPVPPAPTPRGDASIEFETSPGNYAGLWLGEVTTNSNVRRGPSFDHGVLKTWPTGRRVLLYVGVRGTNGDLWYRVSESPEPPMYVHSSLVRRVVPVQFEEGRWQGRWININISQQIVTAYEGGVPVRVTLTSTGTSRYPTEVGVWKIFYRLPKQDMEGGSRAEGTYYYLEDVPYPQYFHMSGEGLHGTYWHDNFGRRMSHGCVNLSIPISEWFYGWASLGTIVWVHY